MRAPAPPADRVAFVNEMDEARPPARAPHTARKSGAMLVLARLRPPPPPVPLRPATAAASRRDSSSAAASASSSSAACSAATGAPSAAQYAYAAPSPPSSAASPWGAHAPAPDAPRRRDDAPPSLKLACSAGGSGGGKNVPHTDLGIA